MYKPDSFYFCNLIKSSTKDKFCRPTLNLSCKTKLAMYFHQYPKKLYYLILLLQINFCKTVQRKSVVTQNLFFELFGTGGYFINGIPYSFPTLPSFFELK